MKILVTGGAGFIGSHLVDRLLDDGHIVTVLDNLSTGTYKNFSDNFGNRNFRFVRGSIMNRNAIECVMENVELVYHLAAVVGVAHVLRDSVRAMMINIKGTENVVQAAMDVGARLVFASSSEIYGKTPTNMPIKEDHPRVMGSISIPRWSYAAAKVVDEYLVNGYFEKGLHSSIVRYFNVYGSRMDARGYGSVIAKFITQALDDKPLTVYGDGIQSRSFIHVKDAVAGTILAGTCLQALGQTFNIGNPQPISMNSLAEMILDLTGWESHVEHVDPPYRNFDETRYRVPCIEFAWRLLDFIPMISLKAGLEELIEQRSRL